MTEQRFFRIMTAMPIIVPIVAAAIGLGLRSSGGPSSAIEETSLTIGIVGAYSAVPYLLFLAILYGVVRPSTRRTWHRVLWWSPLIIAFSFSGCMTVYGAIISGEWNIFGPAVLWGELALITGYSYAVLIRLCEWWFRLRGYLHTTD